MSTTIREVKRSSKDDSCRGVGDGGGGDVSGIRENVFNSKMFSLQNNFNLSFCRGEPEL